MATTTGLFALIGCLGALLENHCLALTFFVYISLQSVANVYVALRADGLWLYALMHVFVALLALSFTKQLNSKQTLLRTDSFLVIHVDKSFE